MDWCSQDTVLHVERAGYKGVSETYYNRVFKTCGKRKLKWNQLTVLHLGNRSSSSCGCCCCYRVYLQAVWHQPLNSDIVSQVKLWLVGHPSAWSVGRAVDDMKHCLTFATLTLVTSCKAPLFPTGCAVTFVSPKWLICDQYCHGRSNPGFQIVGSSTREELTTEADFQSSSHWLVMSIVWVSVQRGLRDGRQLQEGENSTVEIDDEKEETFEEFLAMWTVVIAENLTAEQKQQLIEMFKRLCHVGTSRSFEISSLTSSSPTSATSATHPLTVKSSVCVEHNYSYQQLLSCDRLVTLGTWVCIFIMLAPSSGKCSATSGVRPSVCSICFPTLIEHAAHTHRDTHSYVCPTNTHNNMEIMRPA